MLKKINLDNGIRLVVNHMPGMESAVMGVWILCGSRYESERLCGISHFLEHMVFKGTATKSCRKIKEEIEGRGGSLNGFTSEEITCYLAKVDGKHVDTALNILSEMALHAKMDPKDIERERSVILEEIKMYRDMPSHHVHDILNELMWPEHPLGLPVAGNFESIKSISRKDIAGYKDAYYIPKNIVLVLCGNVNYDSVVKRAKQIFHKNPKAASKDFEEFTGVQASAEAKIINKDTEQSHLCIGLRSFGRMHKDRYTLALLHIILGANMSSRLFENVREKRGLAYEIGTEIKRYKETGAFMVNAGIEHAKVPQAVSLIIKELQKIKTEQVFEKELKRAKEFFRVQLLLALENTMENMLWLGDYVMGTGKLPDKNEIIKKAESVSSSDIKRVANIVFKSRNLNLAMIGRMNDSDSKKIKEELGELG